MTAQTKTRPAMHKSPFLDHVIYNADRRHASEKDMLLFDNGRLSLCMPEDIRPDKNDPIWMIPCLAELLEEFGSTVDRDPNTDLITNLHAAIDSTNKCVIGFDLDKVSKIDWEKTHRPILDWAVTAFREGRIPAFGLTVEDIIGTPKED